MRPGKRERIALQQKREEGEISQKEYIKATRDVTRSMRQRKSGTKLHPKIYNQFRAWIATQIGYMPKKVVFNKSNKLVNHGDVQISDSSGEEDETVSIENPIDTERLLKGKMLDDEIVNKYASLIHHRNNAFNSLPNIFVFDSYLLNSLEAHGTKFVSDSAKCLTKFDEALIPVCKNCHWFLLHLLLHEKKIRVYDSWTDFSNKENRPSLESCIEKVKSLLSLVYPDGKQWKMEMAENIPRQPKLDTKSCGVFMLQYAEHISRRASMNFRFEHIPDLRKTMATEIHENKLMQRYAETEFGAPCQKVILVDTNDESKDEDGEYDETEEVADAIEESKDVDGENDATKQAVTNLLKVTSEVLDFRRLRRGRRPG